MTTRWNNDTDTRPSVLYDLPVERPWFERWQWWLVAVLIIMAGVLAVVLR